MAILNGRPINKQLVPHIIVSSVDAAVDFYRRAFDAVELFRTLRANGSGERHHANLRIGESVLAVTLENPERVGPYVRSPQTIGGLNGFIEMFVDDIDAWAERAEREGATIYRKPENMFFGDRYCQLVDPFGHLWAFSTPIETMEGDDCITRMHEFYAGVGIDVKPTPSDKIPA
jgi:PhnB protein